MKNRILWIVIAVSLYAAFYLIHKRALEKAYSDSCMNIIREKRKEGLHRKPDLSQSTERSKITACCTGQTG